MKPGSISTAVFAACALWCAALPGAWSADPPALPVLAKVLVVNGELKAGARVLKPGDGVTEAEEVSTGRGSFATLEFTDRSMVRLMADTRLRIESHRALSALADFETRLRLATGAIEATVPWRRNPDYTVVTMAGSVAVRGTRFRVRGNDEAMLIEVLDGRVLVTGAGAGGGQVAVSAGYGTRVRLNEGPLAPVGLLRAPDVSRVAALQQRPVVRLRFGTVAGAQRYRVLAATDRDLHEVILENTQRRPDVRMVDLRDGEYFFAVRAVNEFGLEGEEARGGFRLKARPLPPAALAPEPDAVLEPGGVSFSWAAVEEAVTYRFQLASDDDFDKLLINRGGLMMRELAVDKLDAGTYYWRIACERTGGDQGPFGDPIPLTVRVPVPPPPPQ